MVTQSEAVKSALVKYQTDLETFDRKYEVHEEKVSIEFNRYNLSDIMTNKNKFGRDSTKLKDEYRYSLIERETSAIVAKNISEAKMLELYNNLYMNDEVEILKAFLEKEVVKK